MDGSSNETSDNNFIHLFALLVRLTLLAAFLSLITLPACSVDTGNSGDTAGDTATMIVRIDLNTITSLRLTNALAASDVNEVRVDVYNPYPVLEQTVYLTEIASEPGVWTGAIAELPVGVPLRFDVVGLDIDGKELFRGVQENVVLTGSTDPADPPETISVTVTASAPQLATIIVQADFSAVTATDVVEVEVQVLNPPPVLEGAPTLLAPDLINSDYWSGVIFNLPAGDSLTFVIKAKDSAGLVIFEGLATPVVLTGVEDTTTPDLSQTLTIPMTAAATDAPVINDVRIGACSLIATPADCQVSVGETALIVVDISGLPNELLTVDFPLENPVNAFTPALETFLTNASGLPTGTPDFTYAAPTSITSSPDVRTQRVQVRNDRGISTEQSFNIEVINSTPISLNFAPVVSGLSAIRENGTGNVTWQATVSDDQDAPNALTHSWSFTQTSALPTPPTFDPLEGGADDANPGGMVLYDETVEGTVTLNVTDSGGATTSATFPVVAGMLPDIP